MKTASPPLAGRATHGSRIVLADGRELIDGIASWWTACHGYNHPHIRAAVEAPARSDAACHVRRHGARAGADAGAAACRAAAGRSRSRVLQRFRLGRGRSRAEDGGAVLAQSRRARRARASSRSTAAITATPPARWRSAIRKSGLHAAVPRPAAASRSSIDLPVDEASTAALDTLLAQRADEIAAHHRRAAGAGRRRHALSRCARAATLARARRPLRAPADLRRDLHRLRPHRNDVRVASRRASCPTSSRCPRR